METGWARQMPHSRLSMDLRRRQILIPAKGSSLFSNDLHQLSLKKNVLIFLQETEEDFFSAFEVIGQKIYQVISGDTLWDLCYNKFDIPLWLLERYNSTISLTRLNKAEQGTGTYHSEDTTNFCFQRKGFKWILPRQ
jgi:hypothetical protein